MFARADVDGLVRSREGRLPASPRRQPKVRHALVASLERFSGLYAIVAIFILFAAWVPGTFLTSTTWQSLLAQHSVVAILALAMLIPLSAGVFDLSLPAILGLSQVLAAWLQGSGEMDPWTASLVALLICGCVGVVNAVAVVKLRVSSFIATLGMTSIIAAAGIALTDNQEVITGVAESFQDLASGRPFGIPIVTVYMLVIAVLIWWLLEHTPKGRYLGAVGGNQEAARLAGIRVERYLMAAFILPALVAGLAGLIYLAQIGSGSLSAGPPFLLPTFAAVFLGATQVRPGRFNVLGTLIAVALLAIGVKGLQLVGADVWVGQLFNGAVLILAVALASLRRRQGTTIL